LIRPAPVAFALLAFAVRVICQAQPLAFEVASVKLQPWTGKGTETMNIWVEGNTLRAEHLSLYSLVEYAYNLKDFQLSGGPPWANSPHALLTTMTLFQVIAKAPASDPPPTIDQFRQMLQALLADRFQLQIHHVSKTLPTYNLVVNKGGPKLKPSSPDEKFAMHVSSGAAGGIRINATNVTIPRLVEAQLVVYVSRPIIDKTGLTAPYDFTFEFVPENRDAAGGDAVSIFTALMDQLGLKLLPSTAPYDTVVIDHAEKPSAN